jgi:hypothetical protein
VVAFGKGSAHSCSLSTTSHPRHIQPPCLQSLDSVDLSQHSILPAHILKTSGALACLTYNMVVLRVAHWLNAPAGPTCSKVRPAQQTGNETRRFSGGQAGDMVVVTANCASSDHRPTLGGRCAIECVDGADYGFFVMAEITSFPAGMCVNSRSCSVQSKTTMNMKGAHEVDRGKHCSW